MRILFTFFGGMGHFLPLASVAQAAKLAGHEVAFGCSPAQVAAVTAAGFDAFALGMASTSAGPVERLPLRPVDMAREDEEFRDRFARRGAQRRAPFTLGLCREWRPAVIVCDEADFGGMIAAERLGLPHATVLVMAAGSFVRPALIGEALTELRTQHGLPLDPDCEMLRRDLLLSPFPPSFRDPAFPLPPTAHSFCPPRRAQEESAPPSWPSMLPGAPLVYFTLGTVFNTESGDLFRRVLAGLSQLPANIIATLGNEIDPAELGTQPPNIALHRFIDQELILPHCRLVVSHGGSGSVAGALAYGKPSVLIPMGADQPLNAARVVALGIGQTLDPITASAEQIHLSAMQVLTEPAYHVNAARLRQEYRSLPGPESAVVRLEQIAHTRRRRLF